MSYNTRKKSSEYTTHAVRLKKAANCFPSLWLGIVFPALTKSIKIKKNLAYRNMDGPSLPGRLVSPYGRNEEACPKSPAHLARPNADSHYEQIFPNASGNV